MKQIKKLLGIAGCAGILLVGIAALENPNSRITQRPEEHPGQILVFAPSAKRQIGKSPALTLIENFRADIRQRVTAVHQLNSDLSPNDVAELSGFLKSPTAKGESPPALHFLKNEVLSVLRTQNTFDFSSLMIGIIRDERQDIVIRDYAVQHLVLWTEQSPEGATDEIQKLLRDIASQSISLAGTALLGLDRLAGNNSTSLGHEVMELALKMARSSELPASARTTAISVCAERGVIEAFPAIEVAAGKYQPLGLRISAIGALVRLGGAKETALLRNFESDPNKLVRNATVMALKRIELPIASRQTL